MEYLRQIIRILSAAYGLIRRRRVAIFYAIIEHHNLMYLKNLNYFVVFIDKVPIKYTDPYTSVVSE